MADDPQPFTPALGNAALTSRYDAVIAVMTREKRWRKRLLEALDPKASETIVDIGAGTGSMAILVKQAAPGARVVAIDPDPETRAIAEAKAASAGVAVEFITAMGDDPAAGPGNGQADKAMMSLVLHQCPQSAKDGILQNAWRMLRPGGRLLIADYGKQRSVLMELLFNQVRALDGYENTRANKDGQIPVMMAQHGFERVEELNVTHTPTGSISLYSAWKPS
jgi:ubiquinone/menaquinone biosynthesis C-methylase UbiE